jgi:hypothetical protein
LLEVALKHQKINQSIKINQMCSSREVSLDITCHKFAAVSRVHPFLQFTKPGANPRCIGDRLV